MRRSRYPEFAFQKRDRLIQEHRLDPYQARGKPREPTVCPKCGVVYHGGRWQWLVRPANAHEELCPACQRIKEGMPAGYVTVGGVFAKARQSEILGLMRNEGERKTEEHPLDRIMEIKDSDKGIELTTTGIHLARRIGDALKDAYDGKLEFHYNEQEYLLRVHWERE